MRLLLATFVAATVALTSASAFGQKKVSSPTVDNAMKKVLAFKDLKKSKVGIYAIDVETNEVVYELAADDSFNPASNMKLVTAAVALETLGSEHIFRTRLAGKVSGSKIDGPIYLQGGGDPLLMWEDLLAMASELRAQGVTSVSGGIVVDGSALPGGPIPPGYDQKDEDASYRAPIGGASVNYNAQTVVVRPAKTGEKADVYLLPPNDHVELSVSAKTADGNRAQLKASSVSKGKGTKITVGGKIGSSADTQYIRKRIDNPALFTGHVLRKALLSVGIEVSDDVKSGERARNVPTLVQHESPALAYTVFLMNKWSNNFMAEMLFAHVGGAKRVTKWMAGAGVGKKGFTSFNGSGLYDGNEITPRQIVQLLDYMADRPSYPEFAAALAVAGRDGSLGKRLGGKSTRSTLRAKTGTLNKVTALSGYMKTKSGRTLAFSILINDPPVYAWKLRRVQDELAEALAGLDK